LNQDGELKEEFRKASPRDIWSLKYGMDREEPNADYAAGELLLRDAEVAEIIPRGRHNKNETTADTAPTQAHTENLPEPPQRVSDIYFDSTTMRWKNGADESAVATTDNLFEIDGLSDDSDDDVDSDEDEEGEEGTRLDMMSDKDVTVLTSGTVENSVRRELSPRSLLAVLFCTLPGFV
jgi:hypothetical protein